MKRFLGGILLLGLLSAPAATQDKSFDSGSRTLAQDKKERGKTPELSKKYREFMQSNKAEMKALEEDIQKDKPEADLKKHLEKIRDNVGKARLLKYRQNDEEAEALEGHFDIFELKLKQDFIDVPWGDKEKRSALHERVQAKCDVCHEALRD